jgi:hypothetical protein
MARSHRLRQPARTPAPHPRMVRPIGPGLVRLIVRPGMPLPVRRIGLDLVAAIDRSRNGEVPQRRR